MSYTITSTDDLHNNKKYQDSLLSIRGVLQKNLLVLKLLGVDGDIINSTFKTAKVSKNSVKQRKYAEEETEITLEQQTPSLLTIEKETLNFIANNTIKNSSFRYTRQVAEWEESNVPPFGYPENTPIHNFRLRKGEEKRQEIYDLLTHAKDKNEGSHYLSLLFLFPAYNKSDDLSHLSNTLSWQFCTGELTEDSSQLQKISLIMALQSLLNDTEMMETTCINLIKNTFLNDYFEIEKNTKNVVLKAQLDLSSVAARDSIIPPDEGNIIRSKINKQRSAIFKKKIIAAGRNNEYQTITRGLAVLLSHVPGVLCHLKIPINQSQYKQSQQSDTWLFAPKYWIEFIENSTAANNPKTGSLDRVSFTKLQEEDGSFKIIYQY